MHCDFNDSKKNEENGGIGREIEEEEEGRKNKCGEKEKEGGK